MSQKVQGMSPWDGAADAIEEFTNLTNEGKISPQYINNLKQQNQQFGLIAESCLDANGALIQGKNIQTEYNNSLLVTRATMIKTRIAATALNAAISLGVSFLISGAIQIVTNLFQQSEKVAESAAEALDNYSSAQEKLKSTKSTITEISDEYQKLAKGVDDFGNRISLNSDEYERYNEITNKIAEMFPELVDGYTKEGNAIIKHKGDIEALTKAYEAQKNAADAALLAKSGDVFDDFKNKTQGGFWDDIGKRISGYYGGTDITAKGMKDFEAFANGNGEWTTRMSREYNTIENAIEKAGFRKRKFTETAADYFSDVLNDDQGKIIIRSILDSYNAEIDAQAKQVKPIISAYLNQDLDYAKLDDTRKEIVGKLVSNLDNEFIDSFPKGDVGAMQAAIIEKFVKPLQDANLSKEVDVFLNANTSFNNSEITVGEYQEKVSAFLELIKDLPEDSQKYFKLAFNIDTEGTNADIEAVKKKLKGDTKEIEDYIKGLNKDDFDIALKIEAEEGNLSIEDMTQKIAIFVDKTKDATESIEKLSEAIDKIQSAYDTAKSVQQQIANDGYLSVDSAQKLLELGDEYLQYLSYENGQLVINEEAFKNLAIAKLENLKATKINEFNSWVQGLQDEGVTVEELTKKYIGLATAKELASGDGSLQTGYTGENGEWIDITQTEKYKQATAAIQTIDAALDGIYKGGLSSSGNTANAETQAKKIADINKRYAELAKQESLDIFKQEIEAKKALIQQLTDAIELVDFKLELTDDSDYISKMDSLNMKYDLLKQRTAALNTEFSRLNATAPQSADEWSELANRISSISDEMRSNLKETIELRKEMQMLSIDAISGSAENVSKQLEREMSTLDRALKKVAEGSIFDDDIFNIDFMIPEIPLSALDKKRRFNDSLIAEEQRHQDTVNEIIMTSLAKQSEANVQARAEERAQLQADLEEAKGIVTTKLQETEVNAKIETDKISNDVQTMSQSISATVINPPSLNTEAWDSLEAEIKTRFDRILSYGNQTSTGGLASVASQFVGQNNQGYKFSSGRNEEWCADFIGYIANIAGVPIEKLTRSAAVRDFYSFFSNKGALYDTPRPDDIIIFGKSRHVGIVESVNGNQITVIEGNTGNKDNQLSKVSRNTYDLEKLRKEYGDISFGRYAKGGKTKTEDILVGEKGYELAKFPDGRVQIVGKNGAEIINAPVGTEIHSHDETKDILKYTGNIDGYQIPKLSSGNAKFDEIIEKYSVPQQYYSKEFAARYGKYAAERSINMVVIRDSRQRLSEMDTASPEYQNLRAETLQLINEQLGRDIDTIFDMQSGSLAIAREQYQSFYTDLVNGYKEYLENVENGDTIFDEEVANAYIQKINELSGKIGDIDDQISEANEKRIEQLKQIDQAMIKPYKEALSTQQHITEELQKQMDMLDDSNLQGQAGLLNEIQKSNLKAIEDAKAIQDKAHADANMVRANDKYKSIFDNYDVERWFDENNEATSKFEEDLKLMTSDDQALAREVFERMQGYKNDWVENEEEIYQLNKANKDVEQQRKDLLQTCVSEIERATQKLIEPLEKQIEYYDYIIAKEQALVDAEQKRYDVQNQIKEAQNEINASLAASMKLSEWLDPRTRKLIFNDEDYSILNKKLSELNQEVLDINAWYNREIGSLTEENWYLEEAITKEYERRLEAKTREYEVAQKELDVAKKQTEYENILKERNTRVFVAGQWIWTADLKAASQAAEETVRLEQELADLKAKNEQQAIINQKQANVDGLNNTKLSYEAQINMINEQTEKMRNAIEEFLSPVQSISSILSLMGSLTIPGLNSVVNEVISVMSRITNIDYNPNYGQTATGNGSNVFVPESGRSYASDVDYQSLINEEAAKPDPNTGLLKQLESMRNSKIESEGLPYDKTYKYQHNASGTKKATKGLSFINENGDEAIITKFGTLIPMANLTGGETIFNKGQVDRLWELSKSTVFNGLDKSLFKKIGNSNSTVFNGGITINEAGDGHEVLTNILKAARLREKTK